MSDLSSDDESSIEIAEASEEGERRTFTNPLKVKKYKGEKKLPPFYNYLNKSYHIYVIFAKIHGTLITASLHVIIRYSYFWPSG